MKKLRKKDKIIIKLTPTVDCIPFRTLVKRADAEKRATVGPDLPTKCYNIYNNIIMNIECSG